MTEDQENPEAFPSFDELIGSFIKEPSLWPVLFVVIGSGGALGAAILILTGVDHNPFAAAALLLLFGMSVDLWIQTRRKTALRSLARLVGLIWLSAIALALVAIWTGIAF